MGYRVAVWDQDPDAPALRAADFPLAAPFTDQGALTAFSAAVSVATYEWENIPVTTVHRLAESVPVHPAPAILQILQNRLNQKTFLARHGIPVAPFQPLERPEDLERALSVGLPALVKTTTQGYDGKGQWRLLGPDDVCQVREALLRQQSQNPSEGQWIVEQCLAFAKELSVLVVRGAGGDVRSYPVVENVHEAGILRTTCAPAAIDQLVATQATALAERVVMALDGVGVFCVELFLMPEGTLYVNEVAPRPHNSGHYTIDACPVSQFAQLVRVLCGLPLGEVRLTSPAVMVNLLGDDIVKVTTEPVIQTFLSRSNARVHLYGKKSVRPGRKMGHVTFVADTPEAAWAAARTLLGLLGYDSTEETEQPSG
jgi:5-(carboxyamino)imidazole ribonucleotide synthase